MSVSLLGCSCWWWPGKRYYYKNGVVTTEKGAFLPRVGSSSPGQDRRMLWIYIRVILGFSTPSWTLLPQGKYPSSSFGSYQPQPRDSSSEGSALQTADPLALAQGKVFHSEFRVKQILKYGIELGPACPVPHRLNPYQSNGLSFHVLVCGSNFYITDIVDITNKTKMQSVRQQG